MPIFALPPGMLALTDGGDQHDDYEDIGEGPWPTHRGAREFRDNELHPELANASRLTAGPEGWSILVPRSLRQQITGSGQQEVLAPTHAVHAPAEPDYHDPAYPKVISWHNDIAYTVPVHPQALSKEHMQALADYEVHRRQHEKLEKQLHGEHDEYGDRPWVVSEEAGRRLDRSQQQLHRLRDIAKGAGHAAVGTINSYHKFARRKFYQAVRQGQRRQYRGQVLPDREAAIESMFPERRSTRGGQLPPDLKVEEFPGIWSIVDHRGRVVWSGLSSHPYFSNFGGPGWRERVLADARNKNLVARRLSHSFGDPPDIDLSKVPITTWGKTRKKTGEWFSNLSPGMIPAGEPLQLAGTEPVQQEPWQEYGMGGGTTPIKYKYVPLHEGPGPAPVNADTLFFEAAPSTRIDEYANRARAKHDLDYPHQLTFARGEGEEGASAGSFDITGQGEAGKILSHAAHAIKELARNYRPMDIHFSAAEPSRAKAYAHLMHRLANDEDIGRNYIFRTRRGMAGRPGSGSFYIVHRAVAHLPEYQGMRPVEKVKPAVTLPSGMKQTAGPGKAVSASNLPPGILRLDGGDLELSDPPQERLKRLGMLADAGDTDLLPDEYLPSDEELREDTENAIPGHHPPDYHGMARKLEEQIRAFRGRVRVIGSKGIMLRGPHGTTSLRIENDEHFARMQQEHPEKFRKRTPRPMGYYEPESRTLVIRQDAGPKDIMREWVHVMHAMRNAGKSRSGTLAQYRQFEEEPTMEDIARMGLSSSLARSRRRTSLPPGMLALGDEPRITIDLNGPNLPKKGTTKTPAIKMAAGT